MKENNVLKIISNCLSRFPLLSVIFSSVKCWSWAGTLLQSANVQSGISLCSSKAFCAGLFCQMPICHWSSPLLSSASCQLWLAYFTSTKESAFFHFSPPLRCSPFAITVPCNLKGVTLQQSSSCALLCFPSFNTYRVVLLWPSKAPKVHFYLSS